MGKGQPMSPGMEDWILLFCQLEATKVALLGLYREKPDLKTVVTKRL